MPFRGFPLEFLVAARYLRGQGRTVIFSLGTRLSLFFMALFVFIMVVVLSVFTGFQDEVHSSLWNSGYHITVSDQDASVPLTDYQEVINSVVNDPRTKGLVRSGFASVSVNTLLEVQNRFEGKALRALPADPAQAASGKLRDFPQIVHYNRELMMSFPTGNYVIVGREMARHYGWQVGDRVRLFLPQGGNLARGMEIRQEDFTIAGFFRTGYYEFDLNLMFISLSTAQRILGLQGQATEVIFQLTDLAHLDRTRRIVRENLPGTSHGYSIRTIKDERGNFLAALQLEKTLMILILGLLILAGVAGIWVTVHLLVKAKSRSIGMLRAMGLPTSSILVIFTSHSMLIGLISTAIGGSLGIYISNRLESIIQMFEDLVNTGCAWFSTSCVPVQLIPKNIYYFDHLPVHADLNIIFGIALTTMILSGLAGYFPARQAAVVDPAQTIRND